MKSPKPRYTIVISQRGSTLYGYCSLIEGAKCQGPRTQEVNSSKCSVHVFVVVQFVGVTFCLVKRLTILLTLDEMLW